MIGIVNEVVQDHVCRSTSVVVSVTLGRGLEIYNAPDAYAACCILCIMNVQSVVD